MILMAFDGQLIEERRTRATGTTVQLVYSPSADEENPWETICLDHGGVCSHQTRALAEGWLAHPDEWCEDCMHGPGTLDGSKPVDNPTAGNPVSGNSTERSTT